MKPAFLSAQARPSAASTASRTPRSLARDTFTLTALLAANGCVYPGDLAGVEYEPHSPLGVTWINGVSAPSSANNQVEATVGLRHRF
jgi:hypothetical protein